ncbi:hypothetical protein ACWEO2_13865 [Nocardia sp. NPDC004278]
MTANAPPNTLIETAAPDSSDPRPSTFSVLRILVRALQWFLDGLCIYGLSLHGYSREQVSAADHSTGVASSF